MEYKGIITLDAGHGGKDPGALGKDGSKEKDNTLSQSLILKNYLEEQGFRVYSIRDKDEYIDLTTRKNMSDKNSSDLLLSIHNNYFTDAKANGIETWNYPGSEKGRKVASYVQEELAKETGLFDRGNKEAKFTVLTGKSTAILVELGFISNDIECKLLASKDYQNIVAVAITKAICKYFNVPYIEAQCDCAAHGTITASVLNVRSKMEGNIIGQLKLGNRVSIIAIIGEWCKIIYKEHVAYVSGKYVKID